MKCLLSIFASVVAVAVAFADGAGGVESVTVRTKAPHNQKATFWCHAPSGYDAKRKKPYQVLVYFGGRNCSGGADASKRYELRARFLGDAIPAESFAMGANKLGKVGVGGVSLMDECMDNKVRWPRKDEDERMLWCHSDCKQLAYCFVHKLFEKISKNEGGD